jgi:hypothetical protein
MPVRFILRHKFTRFLVTTVTLLVATFIFTSILSSDRILISGESGYSVTGDFAVEGHPPIRDSHVRANQDLVLWGSWMGDAKHTGQLISPVFKAPSILSLFLSGYPDTSRNALFVERTDTQTRLKLKAGRIGENWVDLKWTLPTSWHGKPIRIVAIDEDTTVPIGWFGISSPRAINWFGYVRSQLSSLAILPLYSIHFLLFLIPGIALAFLTQNYYKFNDSLALIWSIFLSSFLGYATFWIYFLDSNIGQVFSWLILIASFGYLLHLYRQKIIKINIVSKDIILPLAMMFLAGVFYLSILYIIDLGELPEMLAQVRFFDWLPPDNVIPHLFAEKQFDGDDTRNLIGDWLSSDRPPLLTGLILIQRPLFGLIKLQEGFHYQILATLIQCSWIPAMLSLCRTVNLSGYRIAIVMAFSIFSGFFLLNSVFVWPKLLAAALVIFAFILILQAVCTSQVPSTSQIGLAAAAAALGMMSHSGVAFTLPAMALIVMLPQYFPGIRRLLLGCIVFALIVSPWIAYQKFYAPPGNRLIKWHVAGVVQIDNRSSLQAIKDSYGSLELSKIANYKWQNFRTLLGSPTIHISSHQGRRNDEFLFVVKGLGILNIGWLILLPTLLVKPLRAVGELKAIVAILGVSLVSLVLWILIIFGPGTTSIHAGSYATMMLLFVGLSMLVTRLPNLVTYFLLSIHIVNFVTTWILTTPPRSAQTLITAPNVPLILLAIAASIGIAQNLIKLSKSSNLSNEKKAETS